METDPPLDQVVARTIELGARGAAQLSGVNLGYDLAAFHTVNSIGDATDVLARPTTARGSSAPARLAQRGSVSI